MSKYFPENNIDLSIYTPSNPEYPAVDNSIVAEVNDQIKIIKQPIKEPYTFYKKFTGKSKDKKIYSGFINDKKSFAQAISVWIRGNFFIPDARMFWIRPSIRYLTDIIEKEKFDLVISTGPPHSMHMIARGLKREFPDLKWIADFRDPWTNIDFYDQLKLTRWADKKHRTLEKSVLQEADKVVTVGQTLAQELKILGDLKQVEVITNGYDHLDFQDDVEPQGEFRIVHLGSMNQDRNPEVLWRALSTLKEKKITPKVQIIGQSDLSIKNSLETYDLANQVELTSFVPHDEAIKNMKSAHVLLLVINNTPNAAGILTGKLFEYLGAKRPIIVIGPAEGDVKKLLREFQHTYYIQYDDLEKCKKVVTELWDSISTIPVVGIEKYSRQALAEDYCNLIKEMCL